MSKRAFLLPIAGVALASILSLAGCGAYDAAHNYNAPTPVRRWQPINGWTRIMTPGNFPGMVMACRGKDGIYDNMDGGSSPFVVPNDPECT